MVNKGQYISRICKSILSSSKTQRVFLHTTVFNNKIFHTSFVKNIHLLNRVLSTSSVMMNFAQQKDKYLNMSLEEKRSEYSCKSKFVTLKDIQPWSQYSKQVTATTKNAERAKDKNLNEKVSIFVGDITALEIDAIVNAANTALKGGGGVDGAIHRAAGPNLLSECKTLNGCLTGEAKITGGYKLPAKYVIHTAGPIGEKSDLLHNSYINSLKIAKEEGLRTVAFPCISTGVYGYPNQKAAVVAIETVRDFLEQNESSFDRVIFCLFLPVDVSIYEDVMQQYFPV